MKQKISVVIICKNEAHIIGTTIKAVQALADEILLYDTGSTDDTIPIARSLGARIIEGPWEGYGKSKQEAIKAAANDWVLNLDSDEVPSPALQQILASLPLDDEKVAYKMPFRNYLGSAALRYGEFGFDAHVRLFNRRYVMWNAGSVHEKLMIPPEVTVQKLKGAILHYTMKDTGEFANKSVMYGLLNAEQYFRNGKKASWVKQFIAPTGLFGWLGRAVCGPHVGAVHVYQIHKVAGVVGRSPQRA
jgi:glycosyltransferase involved in cell wall biosynthesis